MLYAQLARLGRWPRRLAALLCLALAALSALSAQHQSGADAERARPARSGVAAGLAPGQVAVPVSVGDGSVSAYIHGGDRVDLYAATGADTGRPQPAALVASRLLVITVLAAPSGTQQAGGTRLLVAADRITAGRIAGSSGREVLAVVDKYP